MALSQGWGPPDGRHGLDATAIGGPGEGVTAVTEARTRPKTSAHPLQGLAIRAGLSSGEASFENNDWFGVPVVEAARQFFLVGVMASSSS